ncbi:hypothetical protein [Singulisphaera sp. PoT]
MPRSHKRRRRRITTAAKPVDVPARLALINLAKAVRSIGAPATT